MDTESREAIAALKELREWIRCEEESGMVPSFATMAEKAKARADAALAEWFQPDWIAKCVNEHVEPEQPSYICRLIADVSIERARRCEAEAALASVRTERDQAEARAQIAEAEVASIRSAKAGA